MVQQDGEAERWAAVDAHVAVGQDSGVGPCGVDPVDRRAEPGGGQGLASVVHAVVQAADLGEVLGEDILIGPLDPAVDDVGDAEAVEVGQLLGGLARGEVTADRQLRV